MTLLEHLLRDRWFARLPPPLQVALAKEGRVMTLAPGQWVYGEG